MLTFDGINAQHGAFHLQADFHVAPGSRVAIMGPSGAGKSTLLNVVAGFLPPTSGRVVWRETDITKLEPKDRPISILFQDNNLFPHLSAAQNVGLGVRASLRLRSDEKDRVRHALDRVGLGGLSLRKPNALSGGQQSRVALARILVQDQPLVLLDEPFAALGPGQRSEMLDLVVDLLSDRQATMLMVTHNPEDARRLNGTTIFVEDGIAMAPTPTEALLADPPDALRAYL